MFFLHSEGGTSRHEVLIVVKEARTTRLSWLVACDVTMVFEDFNRRLWFREKSLFFFFFLSSRKQE